MRRILFLCSQNRLRSPTAEQVFSTWPGIEAASAGLGADATVPLSPEHLEWADIVFVMEKAHKNKLTKKFGRLLRDKRVICLGIPDEYEYMGPELIRILKAKVPPYLRLP
jgi:predicted protein tyrosine phosphatase